MRLHQAAILASLAAPRNRPPVAHASVRGAGVPRPELPPQDVPPLLMHALSNNDSPHPDAGLHSMWAFAGDTTRFVYRNNRSEFVEDAHETAASLPTSFYGTAMRGQSWEMEGSMNMVGQPESCWIATQIMKTVSSDGRMRRWQWGACAAPLHVATCSQCLKTSVALRPAPSRLNPQPSPCPPRRASKEAPPARPRGLVRGEHRLERPARKFRRRRLKLESWTAVCIGEATATGARCGACAAGSAGVRHIGVRTERVHVTQISVLVQLHV